MVLDCWRCFGYWKVDEMEMELVKVEEWRVQETQGEALEDGSSEVVASGLHYDMRSPVPREPGEASIEVWYPRAALGGNLGKTLDSGAWGIYGKYIQYKLACDLHERRNFRALGYQGLPLGLVIRAGSVCAFSLRSGSELRRAGGLPGPVQACRYGSSVCVLYSFPFEE